MEIKINAVEKALRLLEASGASFHVKLDNQEWGKAIITKSARKPSKYPRGSITAHIKPYLLNVKVNDAVAVPFGEFDGDTVRATMSSYLSDNWGNGSYMIHKAKNQVEVLRLS